MPQMNIIVLSYYSLVLPDRALVLKDTIDTLTFKVDLYNSGTMPIMGGHFRKDIQFVADNWDTFLLLGVGGLAAASLGTHVARRAQIVFSRKPATDQWVKGGFKAKMDRKEAIAILGLKYVAVVLRSATKLMFLSAYRDTPALQLRFKDAHRQIMLANHPDRGGSPYIASKINQARDLLEKAQSGKR